MSPEQAGTPTASHNSTNPEADSPTTEAWTSTGRARRWPLLLIGGVAGAIGVLAIQQLSASETQDNAVTQNVELSTAAVSTGDLLEEIEWAGEVAYAEKATVIGTGGTITGAIASGTVVERGGPLVEVDARPMTLFYGDTPMYRQMERYDEGPDIFVLESNLVELGYDPDGTVTVDNEFTYYTELMVLRWQEDLGVEATGVVEASDILVLDGPALILDEAAIGSSATGNLLTLAPQAELTITVPVDIADADEFATGDNVDVILPDDTERAGTVATVGTEVTTDQNGSTIDLLIALTNGNDDLLEGPVVVRTLGEEIRGATVVPTRALIALAEGGFGVEKVGDAGDSRLIGIEIGAFDDGLVEVTAGDLAPGDQVVVPK